MTEAEADVRRHRRQLGRDSIEAFRRTQHEPGLAEQPLAGRRQLDAARRPFEQLQAELGLELADALRQRWCRHVQPGCGATEVALLRHGHEVPQAAQVDAVRHSRNVIERDMIRVEFGRGRRVDERRSCPL